METTRERFGRNVAEIRTSRGITVRELSARTEELGHRIAPSSISKIESGVGAADPDQIIVLALALRTTPNRLLLVPGGGEDEIQLSPKIRTVGREAWAWASGETPLDGMFPTDMPPTHAQNLFIQGSLPPERIIGRNETFGPVYNLMKHMEAAHGVPYEIKMDSRGLRIEPVEVADMVEQGLDAELKLHASRGRLDYLEQQVVKLEDELQREGDPARASDITARLEERRRRAGPLRRDVARQARDVDDLRSQFEPIKEEQTKLARLERERIEANKEIRERREREGAGDGDDREDRQ